jgi:hypothetical protein
MEMASKARSIAGHADTAVVGQFEIQWNLNGRAEPRNK